MPKRATPLTVLKVSKAPPGRYFDGDGLVLLVRDAEGAWWLFRYTRSGRTRDMGLGRARGPNSVSLAAARARASVLRGLIRSGLDPLAEREADEARKQAEAAAATAAQMSFEEVANQYIAAHEASWRSAVHRRQWKSSLRDYVFPKIGKMAVSAVGTGEVMAIIGPIWNEKTESAGRIRGRIEVILDYAKARGWRDGENPARWRGHLDNLLPARPKVRRIEHHAALPWRDIGEFVGNLRSRATLAAKATEFSILTAARSGEVRGAQWKEIDFKAACWTIPGERIKAGKMHRIPLAPRALEILRELEDLKKSPDDFIFASGKNRSALDDAALLKTAKAISGTNITQHGFRSSFRDWTAEETTFPREIAEAALAHTVGAVEGAYQRGDLFKKRSELMEAWARFCDRPAPANGSNVTQIRAVG